MRCELVWTSTLCAFVTVDARMARYISNKYYKLIMVDSVLFAHLELHEDFCALIQP